MGIKTKVLIIVAVFLVIQGIAIQVGVGSILNIFIPNTDLIIGKALCVSGGFILNPMVKVGGYSVPLPTTDNFVFATLGVGLLTILFFRKIKSKNKAIIAILLSLVILMYVYSAVGYILLHFANTMYGQENCAEEIDLGLFTFEFNWLEPILLFGVFFMIISVFGLIYSVWRKPNTPTGG